MSTQPITLDMSTAQPIQAAPVTLDMSTARPINGNALDLKNASTIPNARIRNMTVDPTKDVHSAGQAFYEGAKVGALAAAPLTLPGATIPGLITGVAGATVGSVAGKQIAKSAGAGEFGQEVGGDVGGLAGGALAAGGTSWAASKARAIYNALPEAVQKEMLGVLSPRLAHAARIADALGIGVEPPPTNPGAPLPATPAAEVLQAQGLGKGAAPVSDPSSGLGKIPVRATASPAISPTTPAAEVLPSRAPRGAAAAAQNFKAIKQAQALRDVTQNVVDQAIPPNGGNLGLNKRVQEQVNSHLAQGDVAAAESVLDEAAKSVNPKWDPNRPKIVPSVQNIRENLQQVRDAESGPTRVTPDSMDDHALQQEMNWDLEKHGYRAESEARREFIARNSTGTTKGDLTAAAQKSAGTPAAEDLTPEWRAALDDLRKKAKK